MAIPQSALEKIIGGARALCSPEGDRLVNEYKVSGSMNFNDPDPASFDDPYEGFGNADYDDYYTPQKSELTTKAPVISENKLKNSKLPAGIRESFANHQIDTMGLSNISVLDQLPDSAKQRIAGTVKVEKKAPVREQTTNMGGSFDYTALKAVMKECIEEYFSAHPINENTLRQINLKEGKINLVDNKGNVFGADLVYKKNLNENKQK